MKPLMCAAAAMAIVLLLRPPAWLGPWHRAGTLRLVRADRRADRAYEVAIVEALAAELVAGSDPVSGLLAALGSSTRRAPTQVRWAGAQAAARTGGDVASALRADAGESDLPRAVAACWEVAAGSGAGLAASLTTLADAARETDRVHDELRAGLAEPRATAMVLTALPVLGLGLGSLLGAAPLQWLVATRPGELCLGLGIALTLGGALWVRRITRALEARL